MILPNRYQNRLRISDPKQTRHSMIGFYSRGLSLLILLLPLCAMIAGCFLMPQPAIAVPQEDGVVWGSDLDEAKKKSRILGLPILIKFEADWCQPCQLLNKEFEQAQMFSTLEQVVPVVIDVDRQEEVAEKFDVTSIPRVILINDVDTVLADKMGFAPAGDWKTWIEESLKDTEFSMPEELASFEPPTSTEVEELLGRLKAKDAAMRELAMERLGSFPEKTRKPVVEVLTTGKVPGTKKKPSLSQQLAVLEVLKRWGAPTAGIDPWTPGSLTEERLRDVQVWTDTPIEELTESLAELSEEDLRQAGDEIDQLLAGRSVKAGLSRLTRYGKALLPQVYERIKTADSDDQVARLTALRYWLTASNQLRLGWSGGLIELAGSDAETRRAAAAVLVKRAGEFDQALLMELFADPDPLVRELALKGLNGLGSEGTEQAMVRLLKDPDPNVRAAVLKQFAESKTQSAIDAVADYLKSETDSGLVVQAIRFMREVGGSKAVKAIVPFVDHENWQVRAELAESLGKIDGDSLPNKLNSDRVTAIIKLMSDEDSFVAVKASEGMPSTKDRKLIDRLAVVATEKPEIAEKIIESLVPSEYDDDAVNVSKLMLGFLDSEHPQVRRGGLKGLQSAYKAKLDDAVLTRAIQDPDEKNRILGMRVFVERLSSIRPDAPEDVVVPERVVVPQRSLFSRIFGFGAKSEPAIEVEEAIEDLEIEIDPDSLIEEVPMKSMDEPNAELAEESSEETDEELEDETDLERWLAKFVDGKIKDTKFAGASQAIAKALENATSEDEIFAAGVALAAYGETERIPGLIESAKTADMKQQLAGLLIWVPFDDRVNLIDTIVTPETTEEELDTLVNAFASVSNPQGAKVFWKLAAHPNIDLDVVYRSFYQLVFNGNENYYSVGPIQTQNRKAADQLVASVPPVEGMGDNVALLALALLNHMDQTKAKQLGTTLGESEHSDEVKHLAIRVRLRTQKYLAENDWGQRAASKDRSHAVEFLKLKNPVYVTLALKYIALGEKVLKSDVDGSERFQLVPYDHYGSNSRQAGTAKVFDPPRGLTEAMLEFDDIELSEEGDAYVTYLRSLFDANTDLKPLLDYHSQHLDDEQMNRLVVRSIAATNNDDLVEIVEKIYAFNKAESDSSSDHADLYWTIRPMDGEKALKLRKRMRDKEGISSLQDY